MWCQPKEVTSGGQERQGISEEVVQTEAAASPWKLASAEPCLGYSTLLPESLLLPSDLF